MDALETALKWTVFVLLMPIGAALVAPPSVCQADDGAQPCNRGYWHEPVFDGTTLCKWRRTWNAQNSLMMPLDQYYIPRRTDLCDFPGYANGFGEYGCGAVVSDGYVMENDVVYEDECVDEYGCSHAPGLQAGLERLGQIPNDLTIVVGAPAAPARPGR